jgi:hypothetical protein
MVTKLIRLTHNSDTTAPSGTVLYHLQFSLHAASPEAFWLHPRIRFLLYQITSIL